MRALTTIWIAVLSWTLSVVWLISQLSHDAIFGKIVQSAQRFLFQETAKINLKRRRAYFHGENLSLTPKQFIVLQILVERMGEVVTKEELCEAAWETDHDVYADDALKYHVREIRRKLG